MTKKYLTEWYNQGNITYSEKERLNKIGVSDYGYHYLLDLEQLLRCENWAKNNSEIRNNLGGRIKKIVFFTPNFNDSKPDASNYSCAIVTDGNDNVWVISYRPSYVANIESDLVIKSVSNSYDVERRLNGSYPVTAIESVGSFWFSTLPHINKKTLPRDVRSNPDKYILPGDIVSRPSGGGLFDHYAVYAGNGWVVHLPGGGEPTQFATWYKFCNPEPSSGSNSSSTSGFFLFPFGFSSTSASSGSSSSLSLTSERINLYHPQIPYKRKGDIIRHMAKVVSYGFGKYSYSWESNNCEHLVKVVVLGLANSEEVKKLLPSIEMLREVSSNNLSLTEKIEMINRKLDNLTSSYSYEKGKIEQYISQTESNRSYTRSKYQIEQEKFESRIEVYPKDWCRIS